MIHRPYYTKLTLFPGKGLGLQWWDVFHNHSCSCGQHGAHLGPVGPMLAPWTLLSGFSFHEIKPSCYQDYKDNPWWPSEIQALRPDSIWHASLWAVIVCNSITVASGCAESRDISWIYTASPQFPWGYRRDLLITLRSQQRYLCKGDTQEPQRSYLYHMEQTSLNGEYILTAPALANREINSFWWESIWCSWTKPWQGTDLD